MNELVIQQAVLTTALLIVLALLWMVVRAVRVERTRKQ